MKDTSQEQERVRQLIHEAFAGITLGRGVSLHETVVIDDYGSTQARQKAREKDEKKDWRKLVDAPELKAVTGIGGLSFFDAEGLRFHLPAYMCLALVSPYEDVVESLTFTLTSSSDYNKERFAILNAEQREAVKVFLIYLRDLGGDAYDFTRPKIEDALANYWR